MPRSIVDSKRAFVVVYKGNAEIVHTHDTHFNTPNLEIVYPKPSVIRILRYVNLEYRNVPLTRNNILKRDNYHCVYCGNGDKRSLTIDHVVPKSKGGKDKWDNVVTACNSCNNEKADLTIEEWGVDDPNPRKPHFLVLMKHAPEKIPLEWRKYLFI